VTMLPQVLAPSCLWFSWPSRPHHAKWPPLRRTNSAWQLPHRTTSSNRTATERWPALLFPNPELTFAGVAPDQKQSFGNLRCMCLLPGESRRPPRGDPLVRCTGKPLPRASRPPRLLTPPGRAHRQSARCVWRRHVRPRVCGVFARKKKHCKFFFPQRSLRQASTRAAHGTKLAYHFHTENAALVQAAQ